MDFNEVRLIGVFDPEGKSEGFTYTVNLPASHNLWIGALCNDGSRMGAAFMAWMLNNLIENDAWDYGSEFETKNQDGITLTARVGDEVPSRDVEAFMALTDTVRKVTVAVGS